MLAPRSSYVVEYSRREISERSQPSIAFWESSQRSMHPNQLARSVVAAWKRTLASSEHRIYSEMTRVRGRAMEPAYAAMLAFAAQLWPPTTQVLTEELRVMTLDRAGLRRAGADVAVKTKN